MPEGEIIGSTLTPGEVGTAPEAPRPRPAIKPTRPVYSHLEAEWLMEIALGSGHERAEYLVSKLVDSADSPEVYAKLRDRVRARITLTAETGDPEYFYRHEEVALHRR